MNHILVTGGAGYVGAVLVPKLLKLGHQVRVIDLFLYADESVFPESPRLQTVRADLRDHDAVLSALKGIDTIIHLAGVSNDPSSDLDPALTRAVNIEATFALIDKARDAGVKRFINASSSSVYGIKSEPNVTEDLALEPLTVYSESKVKVEEYLEKCRGKMTGISIRSATVCGYSPRMRLDLTVNILTYHAVTKGKITVFGGEQKRPNIHIDDITDLYTRLLEYPASLIDGKALNACGSNHTVKDIATLVKETVAPEVPIEIVPTDDLRSYHISADRIKRELGFVPRRSIADASREVAQALKAHLVANGEDDRHYNVRVMKKLLRA